MPITQSRLLTLLEAAEDLLRRNIENTEMTYQIVAELRDNPHLSSEELRRILTELLSIIQNPIRQEIGQLLIQERIHYRLTHKKTEKEARRQRERRAYQRGDTHIPPPMEALPSLASSRGQSPASPQDTRHQDDLNTFLANQDPHYVAYKAQLAKKIAQEKEEIAKAKPAPLAKPRLINGLPQISPAEAMQIANEGALPDLPDDFDLASGGG
jgi:hypothetical protein